MATESPLKKVAEILDLDKKTVKKRKWINFI